MGPGTIKITHEGSRLLSITLSLSEDGDDPIPAEMKHIVAALAGEEQVVMTTKGTAFQKEVWAYLASIPSGETRTYTEAAQTIGRPRSVRAVGGAVGANPWPILIPCHRVIGSNGTLIGFSAGLPWKRFLLSREGSLPEGLERWIDG